MSETVMQCRNIDDVTELAGRVVDRENPYYELNTVGARGPGGQCHQMLLGGDRLEGLIDRAKFTFIFCSFPLPAGDGSEQTFMRVRKRADLERWMNETEDPRWCRVWIFRFTPPNEHIRTTMNKPIIFIQPTDGV